MIFKGIPLNIAESVTNTLSFIEICVGGYHDLYELTKNDSPFISSFTSNVVQEKSIKVVAIL